VKLPRHQRQHNLPQTRKSAGYGKPGLPDTATFFDAQIRS